MAQFLCELGNKAVMTAETGATLNKWCSALGPGCFIQLYSFAINYFAHLSGFSCQLVVIINIPPQTSPRNIHKQSGSPWNLHCFHHLFCFLLFSYCVVSTPWTLAIKFCQILFVSRTFHMLSIHLSMLHWPLVVSRIFLLTYSTVILRTLTSTYWASHSDKVYTISIA